MKISTMLKRIKHYSELDNKELAAELDATEGTLSNWINDKQPPKPQNLIKIHQMYAEIVEGKTDPCTP
jgi:transcriptional regulator with XRE-family HTH domain